MHLTSLIRRSSGSSRRGALKYAGWLQEHMSPFFFQAMSDECDALAMLAHEMGGLKANRSLVLADRPKRLILACPNRSGSLYETLRRIGERDISYAMFSHSSAPMPDMAEELEVQRFEFDRRSNSDIDLSQPVEIPAALVRRVRSELCATFPAFDLKKLDRLLKILWLNNADYVRMSPPARVAYLVWLFDRGNASGGLFIDMCRVVRDGREEMRVLFAVGNPPADEFLLQLLEVFNRLEVGIRRAYCQTISNGTHPYFLGAFFVISRLGEDISPSSPLADRLRRELCTTQILATATPVYSGFVTERLLSGEDAALVNAFIAFCHTTLAHVLPERFGMEDVQHALYDHPEMAQLFIRLFRMRFDPDLPSREGWQAALDSARQAVEEYNTGHRWLDEIRRFVYRACLLLVTRTLKTNFFVVEKQALAFRLDPVYLRELGREFTADLPDTLPFRVTFFFSRYGSGYHVGFSDIARGGWRTIDRKSVV